MSTRHRKRPPTPRTLRTLREAQRPQTARPVARPSLSNARAHDLAEALIRELAEHAGDAEAVNATMLGWLDREENHLSIVCMKAMQLVFRDCLTHVPAADVPPGALALIPPTEGDDAA